MDYKKVIKNKDFRFRILKTLSWVPDSVMIPLQYRMKMGRKCNLKDPQRWTEKLQIYKMYYRNPVLGRCVDKYEVRSYVEEKGLNDILVNLYGLWDRVEDIDFAKLPNSFVLKTTDGGGGENVVLVRDKSQLDLSQLKRHFHSWQTKREPNAGREWAYTLIQRSRIIAEELLVNKANPEAGIEDFKFLCFNGEPKYVIVDKNRYVNHRRNFYTIDWARVDITTDHEQFETPYPKPDNFDEMLRVARLLSEDFPFVRVDLYNLKGRIFFGELTFYPWSGYVQFKPDEFDYTLGRLLNNNDLKGLG